MDKNTVLNGISTERLILLKPSLVDCVAVNTAVNASLPELKPWMVWAQQKQTTEETIANTTEAIENFDKKITLRYHIWHKETQELVGLIDFHDIFWRVPKAEIGYWVSSEHAGKGYASEAAGALSDYGLSELGFRRIEIKCDSMNIGSASVAKKTGYTLDGCFKNYDVSANNPSELRDYLIFSRTC